MRISVVLLTYNGGAKLRQVVAALRRQDIQTEVEYVAVDSGSTDGSVELLRNAGFQVYAVDRKDFSFGPVRQYAFECSSGDVIVTQSQDVVPLDETYLRILTDDVVRGKADVVQGGVRSPAGDDNIFLWDRAGSAFYFTSEGRVFAKRYGRVLLSCTCLAISRAAWQATGFGDTPYSTDKFLQKALAEKGFRITRTLTAVATHGHSYDLRALVHRCVNEGIGWRWAGVRYSVWLCLRDLTVGFARQLPVWWKAVRSRQARDFASIFFFQIRPICLLIGNRLLRRVVR
jgi:glycosyltransferase involved in cell wall biosynthesis